MQRCSMKCKISMIVYLTVSLALVLSVFLSLNGGVVYASTPIEYTQQDFYDLVFSTGDFGAVDVDENGSTELVYKPSADAYVYRGFDLADLVIANSTNVTLGGIQGSLSWNNPSAVLEVTSSGYTQAAVKFFPNTNPENYDACVYNNVYIKVDPSSIEVSPQNQTLVYGGTLNISNTQITSDNNGGFDNSELNLTYSFKKTGGTTTYNKDTIKTAGVGTYNISVIATEKNSSNNYVITDSDISTLTITKRTIKLNVTGTDDLVEKLNLQEKINVDFEGIVNNDNRTGNGWVVTKVYKLNGNVVETVDKPGEYTLVVSLAEKHSANYIIENAEFTFVVKADLTLLYIGIGVGVAILIGVIAWLIYFLKNKEKIAAIKVLKAERASRAVGNQSSIIADLKAGKNTNLSNTTFSDEEIQAQIKKMREQKKTE